jgi:hypothetical protein
MNTTSGPQSRPRYSVLDQTTGRLIATIERDPERPHRWIATNRDRTRYSDADYASRKQADEAVRRLDEARS